MAKASNIKPRKSPRRFEAQLERLRSRLNWVVVYLPFDAAQYWGGRGLIKVKGEINDFGFRTSLFPTREGRHFLLINKRMQTGANVREGGRARFEIEVDVEEREVAIPAELKRLIGQDRSLRRWYDGLNHSTRNDIAKWTTDPKSAAARARRADQMAERLLNVMQAERQLPPVLELAFARNPGARVGWDAMSMAGRRGHLFGIFYYRTPEAQGRRIQKMLDLASAVAAKARNRSE